MLTNLKTIRVLSVLVGLLFQFIGHAQAQLTLDFKRITNKWPQIQLYMNVTCRGGPVGNLTPQNFTIQENGIPVQNFNLTTYNPMSYCCMSVGIALDRSSSMNSGSPSAIEAAKAAARLLVDSLDIGCDEVALISFNQLVTINVPMTTDTTAMKQGINSLTASGATATWDGAFTAVNEVKDHGTRSCRAIILLTDGEDNSSTHTPGDIIALALAHDIRVYTIGLGTSINDSDLDQIARETGGKFFLAPNTNFLSNYFLEIYHIISHHFEESIITYTTRCPDGRRANVDLTVQNVAYCPGTITKTMAFKAPRDTTGFDDLHIRMNDAQVYAKNSTTLVVSLDSAINEYVGLSTFTVTFDDQLLSFTGVNTTGSLLANANLQAQPITQAGVVDLTTKSAVLVNGVGSLFTLMFTAKDPNTDVTTNVRVSSSTGIVRCTNNISAQCTVSIESRKPHLEPCEVVTQEQILFDRSSWSYAPSPLPIDINVLNTGDREARDVQAEILFDPAFFTLLKGQPTMSLSPSPLAPNSYAIAHWELAPVPRADADSSTVTVRVTQSTYPGNACSRKIRIDGIPPKLTLTVDPVTITYDRAKQKYSPMPFTVKARLKNVGYQPVLASVAEIFFHRDLQLDPLEGTAMRKYSFQYELDHNEEAEIQWLVTHPLVLEDRTYSILLSAWGLNTDTTFESVEVRIPAMDGAMLTCDQTVLPAAIRFDTATKKYANGDFTFQLAVTNAGGIAADSVSATLVLPQGFTLDPISQSPTQYLNPMTLNPGGTQKGFASWTIHTIPRYRNSIDTFTVIFSGRDQLGNRITESTCTFLIEVDALGRTTRMSCASYGTDSLTFSPLLGVTPNPFPVYFELKNESLLPMTLDQVSIVHNIPGLTLQSLTPSINKTVMQAGDRFQFTALFKASQMFVQSVGKIFLEYETAEPVMEKEQCEKIIFIDSAKAGKYPILIVKTTPLDSLAFDCGSKQYPNALFTASVALQNLGNEIADSLSARLYLPSNIEFVNPADSVQQMQDIYPLRNESLHWQLHLVRPPTHDTTVAIMVELRSLGKEFLRTSESLFIADTVCPTVQFSSPMLSFTVIERDTIRYERDVVIGSSDGTEFDWIANSSAIWFSLIPLAGKSGDTMKIRTQTEALAPGIYRSLARVIIPRYNSYAELPIECEVRAIISDVDDRTSKEIILEQNYPNPFTTSTTIDLHHVDGRSAVSLKVFDVFGREVLDLSGEANRTAEITIHRSKLPGAGVYYYRFSNGDKTATKMLTLLH